MDQITGGGLMGPSAGGRLRLSSGGFIDRTRPLRFTWDGRALTGYAGDTLASALLAQGERIVGRGFKFHRPRGILSAGAEEPNALVTLHSGDRREPNARATLVPLVEGLIARPQNCWPSVRFDVGRVFDAFSPLWPAGFYNKTFLWPSWNTYEPFIRRTAGLGDALTQADPDDYESVNASCDVLIVGGGPAGLLAARLAARAGLRVILAEQSATWGGSLLGTDCRIEEQPAGAWIADGVAELAGEPRVTLLASSTVFGLYDHGVSGLLERVEERHGGATSIRHRYWRIRAHSILLATGAIEQPWTFERNDLPGVMLAGAIRTYAERFGVAAGRRIVFATNNDSAYLAALSLARAGVEVALLADCRAETPPQLTEALRAAGVAVQARTVVRAAQGRPVLQRVLLAGIDGRDAARTIECDALGVSAGWMPAVHLFSQARGRLAFDAVRQCFLPEPGTAPVVVAGAVAGASDLASTFATAAQALAGECRRLGVPLDAPEVPGGLHELGTRPEVARLRRTPGPWPAREWLDFQHDVTVADAELALREGFDAIELLKRYTTNGMSVDQGKTSNLNALLLVAELGGRRPEDVGTTTFRPPYIPVTLGALAGRQIGEHYAARRYLPAHEEHVALAAHFEEAGGWMRPAWYPRAGESPTASIRREVLAVRQSVGLFDASPLGKIELEGPDAARFLDRLYINNVMTLEIGRTRYGLMLNENGVIIDDGTIARLGPDHFVITTTSGGAARIGAWLEEWHQCEWPDLHVLITPVTTQWATLAVAGPKARTVLGRLPLDIDLDPRALPHLHVRTGTLGGIPLRLYRVSFSGELGYEINVPARYGASLWRLLLEAGKAEDITPYGLEAVLLLRLEKGFLHVGLDTDGTTAPSDVGWGEVALKKKADFVGRRSLMRTDNLRPDRLQLVGLSSDDPRTLIPGAHLRLDGTTEGSDGWVTSAALSPVLGKPVALAMLRGGLARLGSRVAVHDFGRQGAAEVVATPFYDPKGERLNA